jgi:RNA methyltransferase, TrmH family
LSPRGLGPRHADVKRLRALLRDGKARDAEQAFVLEGPRVIEGALERGVVLDALYLGPNADVAFAPLVKRVSAAGTPILGLAEGVLEKVGSTRTPQPLLGIARRVTQPFAAVPGSGAAVVAVGIADPGNLGTIIRSSEAAGVDAVVTCGNSVDAQNPKAVRSSAGAIFGITVMEAGDPVELLEMLATHGRRRLGTRAAGGEAYSEVDFTVPSALVFGNEAHGLAPEVDGRLDGHVTIPMTSRAESLNVAMAATVLVFEVARQRTVAGTSR